MQLSNPFAAHPLLKWANLFWLHPAVTKDFDEQRIVLPTQCRQNSDIQMSWNMSFEMRNENKKYLKNSSSMKVSDITYCSLEAYTRVPL